MGGSTRRLDFELSDRLNQKVVFFLSELMKKTFFYAILFAISFIKATMAHEAVVVVNDVQDGDTFSAMVHDEDTKIRLLDVDCYETRKNARAKFQHEYYSLSYDEIFERGRASKQKLKELIGKSKKLRITWDRRDGFGRILGKVYLDDTEVNQYMLETGGCNKYVPKNALKKH